jgi:site-specific recombinase XerC
MKGAPARAIHELAGHADLATAQRYMHLSPAATEDAIQLLDMRLDAQSRVETHSGHAIDENGK